LWQKRTLFEESARVPFIIAAPGRQAGVALSQPVELLGLYPTLADLCGLPPPPGVAGTSLVPLLEDAHCPWPKAAYTQMWPESRGVAVRTERYRYSEWGNPATGELYDHGTDPHEYTNLVADPAQAQILAQLQNLLRNGPGR
jgi:iduronate 2-sulfatase